MPDTLVGIILLIVFLLPGFLFTRMARQGRPYSLDESELAFVARSLAATLLVAVVFLPWTAEVVSDLQERAEKKNVETLAELQASGTKNVEVASNYRPAVSAIDVWPEKRWEIAAYGLIALIAVPVTAGALVGARLRRAEKSSGPTSGFDRLLGAADPPAGWDRLSSQLGSGGFVVARLKDEGGLVGGKMGTGSYASLSPAEHDLMVEEAWWLDEYGNPVAAIKPRRALWLSGDTVEVLHVIPS
jgi:hypothetical protein